MATAPKSYENFNNRRVSTATPYSRSATEGSAFFHDVGSSPKDVSASKSKSKLKLKPEMEKTKPPPDTLPPDVAEARIERINKELVAMLRKPYDPRGRRKPLQGIGTYTHIDHPASSRDPVFVSLNEEGHTSRDALLEAPLDPGVQRAYDVLKQALEEADDLEKDMYRMKKKYDIWRRYDALPVPGVTGVTGVKRKRVEPPPPPPRPESHVATSSDREMRGTLEEQEPRESRYGLGDKGPTGSFVHDPFRRDSIAMDVAMGKLPGDGGKLRRKGSLPTPVTPVAPSLVGTTYDASRDPRRRGR